MPVPSIYPNLNIRRVFHAQRQQSDKVIQQQQQADLASAKESGDQRLVEGVRELINQENQARNQQQQSLVSG